MHTISFPMPYMPSLLVFFGALILILLVAFIKFLRRVFVG